MKDERFPHRPHAPKAGLKARFEFKLADLWVGLFWKREPAWRHYPWSRTHVWICLVPCFPLHIEWDGKEERDVP